jgi:hypothetical protein
MDIIWSALSRVDGVVGDLQDIRRETFTDSIYLGTGKLLPPKFGILSYMLESVASGRVEDAIICPVSTQYDKVIEVEYVSPVPPFFFPSP